MQDKIGICYLRLSVEDAAQGESNSITSQRKCVQQFLQEHSELGENFEELVDDGYSGTSMNRPGMNRLLQMVERNLVHTIIVRDLSRFARDYVQAGLYLERIFPDQGVRFISVNDNFDTAQLSYGMDFAIRNLLNQLYSRDLSKKIRSVIDDKKRRGEYVFGAVPYGYQKDGKSIKIDPPAALIVQSIFQWAADGITVTQIAQKLNANGVPTPSAYLAKYRGNYPVRRNWTFDSVRNILNNRTYTGDTVVFRSHVKKVGSKAVTAIPEEQQEIVENTHEPIIDRALYENARSVMKGRKKSKPSAKNHPLTSLPICACCGNRLSKGRGKVWRCTSARYAMDTDCQKVQIEDTVLQDILLRAIENQCQLADARLKEQKGSASEETRFADLLREQNQLLRQYQKKKLENYESYVDGKLTKEEFLKEKARLSAQEEEIHAQISLLEQRIEERKQPKSTQPEPLLPKTPIKSLTPELTHSLIHQITVFPNHTIQIHWSFAMGMRDLLYP